MKRKLKIAFVHEMTPVIGVTIIAVLCIVYFLFNSKVFATAMPLSLAGYKFLYMLGIDTPKILEGTGLSEKILEPALDNPTLVLILGFAIGTVLTTLLRGEFKIRGFGTKTHLLSYIVGGFLVGVGVQGIYGANIGEVFGAISMMSLSGWLIMPFIALGVWIMKPIVEKIKDK